MEILTVNGSAPLGVFVVLIIGALVYLLNRRKPVVPAIKPRIAHSVVHVQQRTEEAETLDFAITLFEDETMAQREARILEVCEIAERRRDYNNKRMNAYMETMRAAAQAEAEALKSAK